MRKLFLVSFTTIALIDLFFRFAALGQLMLLAYMSLQFSHRLLKAATIGVISCVAAYLLLTAPIPNEMYGMARNILLAFTDALPYAVCFLTGVLFDDDFAPGRWHISVKIGLAAFACWHLFFFIYLAGKGSFHDVSHGLGILVIAYVLYLTLKGIRDDLITRRRNMRLWFLLLLSLHIIMLPIVQLIGGELRDHPLFNLFNSSLGLVFVLVIGVYFLSGAGADIIAPPETADAPDSPSKSIPPTLRQHHRDLEALMAQGGYREANLGIKQLAEKLGIAEHRLRTLINSHLGYRNFSAFLNDYRLREASEILRDEAEASTPILTIALNLGYGSVGPFNRAFKLKFDQTPSEYRKNFQN